MSLRKKGRKFRTGSGKSFPNISGGVDPSDGFVFAAVIAETLRKSFGGTRGSVKTVMAYTGAGERTVKNWFEGKNAPNGENLVGLVRHSDEILEALLLMAGRENILAGKLLFDASEQLVEMLEIIYRLRGKDVSGSLPER